MCAAFELLWFVVIRWIFTYPRNHEPNFTWQTYYALRKRDILPTYGKNLILVILKSCFTDRLLLSKLFSMKSSIVLFKRIPCIINTSVIYNKPKTQLVWLFLVMCDRPVFVYISECSIPVPIWRPRWRITAMSSRLGTYAVYIYVGHHGFLSLLKREEISSFSHFFI